MISSGWRDVVGEPVRARRESLRLSTRGAARAAGISEGMWREVERGNRVIARGMTVPTNPRPSTRAAVCRALGWSPDSIDRLLTGLPPMPAPTVPPATDVDEIAELRALLFELAAEVKDVSARLATGLAGAVGRAEQAADQSVPPVPQSPEGAP